ncbi:MAG: hypothetical protein LBF76_02165 [Holosporales bacterium]|nr:hypothetical protein [Holosporales bacterium]
MTEKRSIQGQVRLLIGGALGVPGLLVTLTFWADPSPDLPWSAVVEMRKGQA